MQPTSIRYETIEPNIAQVEVQGGQVRVQWKCAATGRAMGESGAWMAADPSTGTRLKASVQRSVVSELVYGAARMASSWLGGAAGRIVSNAVYTAASDVHRRATANADFSDASRRDAVVAAFAAVQPGFVWDDAAQRFVARAAELPR